MREIFFLKGRKYVISMCALIISKFLDNLRVCTVQALKHKLIFAPKILLTDSENANTVLPHTRVKYQLFSLGLENTGIPYMSVFQ
jgi:hypothetical protein